MAAKSAIKRPPLYAFVDVIRTLENPSQTEHLQSFGHYIRFTVCAQREVARAIYSEDRLAILDVGKSRLCGIRMR